MTGSHVFTEPNVEERLSAAAFAILTDNLPHGRRARTWAVRFLQTNGGRQTAFQRQVRTARFGRLQ